MLLNETGMLNLQDKQRNYKTVNSYLNNVLTIFAGALSLSFQVEHLA